MNKELLLETTEEQTEVPFQPTKRTKPKEVAVELRFANWMAKNTNYVVDVHENLTVPYLWNGVYYQMQNDHEMKFIALNWLEKFAPDRANNRTAIECVKTSYLKAKKLPERPKDTIIPLNDCWLHVNPKTGEYSVRQPSRSYGITYKINITLKGKIGSKYVPKAIPKDSYASKFLTSTFEDLETREFIQEFSGYTLINHTPFHLGLVLEGDGANGKSVYINVMSELHQKIGAMRLDDLKRFGLANIEGASLALSSETPKSGIHVEELKQCITGDWVTIERKNKDSYAYRPYAKWIINCNTFPRLNDHTDGVWRRLAVVKLLKQFKGKDVIRDIDNIIIDTELDIFLDWCLAGLSRLLKRGDFDLPESVRANTNQEKEQNDTVMQYADYTFLEQCESSSMNKDTLFQDYVKHCDKNRINHVHTAEFWKRIKSHFKNLEEKKVTINGKRVRMVNLHYAIPQTIEETKEIEEAFYS